MDYRHLLTDYIEFICANSKLNVYIVIHLKQNLKQQTIFKQRQLHDYQRQIKVIFIFINLTIEMNCSGNITIDKMQINMGCQLTFDIFTQIYQSFVTVKSDYEKLNSYHQQEQILKKYFINNDNDKVEQVSHDVNRQISSDIFFSDEQYQPVNLKRQSEKFNNKKRQMYKRQQFVNKRQQPLNKRQISIRRKQRTTITKQKLEIMNSMFKKYEQERENGMVFSIKNLREIGHQLSLGYSTILHKYQQYKVEKVVVGGLRLSEKKRKYKKSLHIEELILKAVSVNIFQSVVELSKFIYKEYNIVASRSLLSRHLNSLGISLRVKVQKFELNDQINSWETNYSEQSSKQFVPVKKYLQS